MDRARDNIKVEPTESVTDTRKILIKIDVIVNAIGIVWFN